MSSVSDQKLFCGVCSAFKCSFDEFVGEKVVSPSYSSAVLAPPPLLFYNYKWIITSKNCDSLYCTTIQYKERYNKNIFNKIKKV